MPQAQAGRHGGRQDQHRGVGGDHRVDVTDGSRQLAGAPVGVVRVGLHHRQAAQRQRAVAADHQVTAQPRRGGEEVRRPVGAGGHQQQHPRTAGLHGRFYRFSGEKNGWVPAA